jgi:hypothetical protein
MLLFVLIDLPRRTTKGLHGPIDGRTHDNQLLEHFMPSLMALKKALPGRQPESFRESFISVECFYKV